MVTDIRWLSSPLNFLMMAFFICHCLSHLFKPYVTFRGFVSHLLAFCQRVKNIYQSYKYQRDATFFLSFIWCYNSTCFGRRLLPSSGVIINCNSSHWYQSWVQDRINPVQESMAVCTMLFHGSMGLKAWWCALILSRTHN